jgi:hypothetical protein
LFSSPEGHSTPVKQSKHSKAVARKKHHFSLPS